MNRLTSFAIHAPREVLASSLRIKKDGSSFSAGMSSSPVGMSVFVNRVEVSESITCEGKENVGRYPGL